ncbi:hypothetical protein GCM10007103_16210 [Salinimicrobium marinum]|uniref:Outer membrane protein beta-barrel domain-containing protein n=1 Tax=Salinimicrobium marinum TaxID=680283 RepID=A0A918VXT2_9FLAO|nr:outer membrane beta-barrel protein [Salinimicrobium marinum]GHA35394.1 hypothetical protein GCM10007103_16210 [Salinimicrobium marinum]
MKKIFLIAITFIFASTANAQDTKFGLTAGYLNVEATESYMGMDVSADASGFYAGVLVDVPLSGSFHLEPAVIYGNAEELNLLFVPVLAKYYISESGFSLLAGPQGTIILDEVGNNVNTFGVDLTFGASYDITENFFLQARYSFELTNRTNNDLEGMPEDVDGSINSLLVGVGYKF